MVTIGGVTLGGRTGERPCVLIGSIFYDGHRIVQDASEGRFDQGKARELVEQQAELSRLTGHPVMLDVIGGTEKSLIAYLEFLADLTDVPLLVDSMSIPVRLAAIRHFAGSSLLPRLVYNSLDEHCTREELTALAAAGVKHAVLMAFSNTALKPAAKLRLLREKLLPAARDAGIENLLVDPGVLDIASVGWVGASLEAIKAEGFPAGCAPSNALYSWRRSKGLGAPVFQAAAGSIFSYLLSKGADFLFYGPMANAPWVFPACAVADAVRAYAARLEGVRLQVAEHPLQYL